jgi:hypothetical protein
MTPQTDLACVIHLHSTHSDGTGTVPEIAAAARQNGIDVVLLTDHDTLAARERGEEGWHGSTLVLAGVEVSPKGQNHYMAFGLDRVIDHRGMSAAGIVGAVARAGGFGFAAHPFSQGNPRIGRRAGKSMPWRDLDADRLGGVELWSFVVDSGEQLGGWRDALRFLARPERYMPELPARNLAEWDRMGAARRVAGIGGLDAHQVGVRIGRWVPLRLMSYRRSFRMLTTHLLVPELLSGDVDRDRALVFDALREGRAYIARDWLAPARGFAFWAGEGDGVPMGAETAERPSLHVRLPRPAAVRLVRDGVAVASADGAAELDLDPGGAGGVYRVEARIGGRLWIVSNPIYLR